MFKMIFVVTAFAVGSAQASLALPFPHGAVPAMPRTFTAQYNFEGIVALSNCSGSLIAFEKTQMTDHAMILTNGHCLETGMPKSGVFVSNRPSNRRFEILSPTAQNMGEVNATKIIYSSMTRTDITIYELQETYAEIQTKFHTRPFLLASAHPAVDMPITVVSGYWKRGYTCKMEAFIPHLKEGGWLWDDSIRYSRPGCEVIGGTSGSPVILAGSRTVVAINNTGNEDGEKCTVNNPCEVDAQGNIFYQRGYTYAEQTYQIYSCINSVNQFDLSLPNCRLFH